jgi:hypothetical protein
VACYAGFVENAWTEFRNEFPSTKQRKHSYQYLSANTVFKVQPPRSPRLTPLDFRQCRHLNLWSIQLQLEMKRYFTKTFFAYKTIHNSPGTFERVRHSMSKCVNSCSHSGGAYLEHFFKMKSDLIKNKESSRLKL